MTKSSKYVPQLFYGSLVDDCVFAVTSLKKKKN